MRDTDHIPQFVSWGKNHCRHHGGEAVLVVLLKRAPGPIKMDGEKVLKWQSRAHTGDSALFMSLGCESALSQTPVTCTRIQLCNLHSAALGCGRRVQPYLNLTGTL